MKRNVLVVLLCCGLLMGILCGCGGSKPAESTELPVTTPSPSVTEAETLEPVTEVPITEPETLEPETEPVTTEPGTEPAPETTEPQEDQRALFYETFRELDPEATDAWLATHPEYFSGDYTAIAVNQAWLTDQGLDLETVYGHQVLAIDAKEGILIVRVWLNNSRGVLAIAKDPSRLHLCASETMGVKGERIGSIAQRNNGVLAMTGSGFIDPNGAGNGGQIAGYCMCDGEKYGRPMGWNYARFELTESNWAVVTHADGSPSQYTTDCMEFTPALLIDGELQDPGIWTGENPRACIGQSENGDILMMGVEGRFKDSPGCSVLECAKVLQQYGGQNAINVDGGTTAIVWYRGEPIIRCSNRNTPEGRYLPNAWVYEKAGD